MSLGLGSIPAVQSASDDPHAALRKHVAEFEGLLLSQILEKLKDAYQLPGEEESDSAGESFQSLANSALGNNLAARGGLGMMNLLIQSLTVNDGVKGAVKPTPHSADVNAEVGRKY